MTAGLDEIMDTFLAVQGTPADALLTRVGIDNHGAYVAAEAVLEQLLLALANDARPVRMEVAFCSVFMQGLAIGARLAQAGIATPEPVA